MAFVKGVKEKIHLPLYDSLVVKPGKRLGEGQSSNVIRFFQDVTGKTKLQTNMQASSLLPHWNTFEARALRVVLSDLAPQFPQETKVTLKGVTLAKQDGTPIGGSNPKTADIRSLTLSNFVTLSRRLANSATSTLLLTEGDLEDLSTEGNTVSLRMPNSDDPQPLNKGEFVCLDRGDLRNLRQALQEAGTILPPQEQLFPHNGAGNVISRFIYNTVTTLYVGEKVMIQVPTWFFPAGAGPWAEDGKVVTHGYPSPEATFRFAEPIFVDTQQNFRVEIEIPESDVLSDIQRLYGPLFIWVVLDGYMTRDVQ